MRPVDLTTTFVYIIDESLKMSKGKIAAQVSHVAMMLADTHGCLGRAIVLKADNSNFVRLCGLPGATIIRDAGLTEVPPGTATCVGFLQTSELKKVTDKLRLV